MFNILRMDLYRLIRSKSVYICLAFLMIMSFLCFWLIWMLDTPEGRTMAAKIGISLIELENDGFSVTAAAPAAEGEILQGYDILAMFREIGMDGGAYTCILGIVVSIFVCHDYNCGFIKNILSQHRKRWKYIGSKLITAGILNLFYLALSFGFCLLLNAVFSGLVPMVDVGSILFYLGLSWLLTTAFAALFILIITLSRSTSAGILSSILLGSGIVVTVLITLTKYWGLEKWADYTLYINQTYAPSCYSGIADLKGFAVGAAFLLLYSAASFIVLNRKDI